MGCGEPSDRDVPDHASKVLDCPGKPWRQGSGNYDTGPESVQDDPRAAVVDFVEEEGPVQAGFNIFDVARRGGEVLFVGDVGASRLAAWVGTFDGSPEALQDIKSWGVKDLDQFYNAGAYERISSRYAPHNVYTSSAQLSALEQSKGYTTSNYTGFARNAKATPAAQPTATSIDMTFSGYYYNTHYDYDAATNTYKRSEGGAPHMELHKDGSQVQIAPTVLVALIMPYSLEADGYHSDYQTIGSGKMYIFQGGAVQTGTWTKSGRTSQLVFTDDQGQPLKLDPGQTWISALASTGAVTYK